MSIFNEFCSELMERQRFSEELRVTYTIACCLNAISSLSAVVGNIFILVAVKRNAYLHRPSFLFLCSLASSDLGVGLVAQPLYVAFRIAGMKGLHRLHCQLGIAYNLTTIFLAWLSLLTITCISIDRFLAVYLHSKYRSTVTIKRVKKVVVVLWVIAALVNVSFIISVTVYWIVINVLISISIILTSFNYLRVYQILYRHQAEIHIDEDNRLSAFNLTRIKKTVNSMLFVYAVFLVCYIPYFCLALVINVIGRDAGVHGANQLLITVIFINSSVNPIVYYWRIPEIRLAVRTVFLARNREEQ